MFKCQLCTVFTFSMLTLFADRTEGQCEQGRLVGSDVQPGQDFGSAIAIEDDVMVIGSGMDDDLGASSGSAYVFERSNGNWVETAKLLASDGQAAARFGEAVAVHGSSLAIGASGSSGNAVYVFDRNGVNWTESGKIVPSDPTVAFYGDWIDLDANTAGELTLAVGSRNTTFIYEKQPDGSWQEVFTMQNLGWQLSMSADTVVVGNEFDSTAGANAGIVNIIERQSGSWVYTGQVMPIDAAAGFRFGIDVDIDDDRLAVAAPYASPVQQSGAAYVFDRQGPTWMQSAKISGTTNMYGSAVELKGNALLILDARWLFGGLNSVDYYLRQGSGAWFQVANLQPSDAAFLDSFAQNMALDKEIATFSARALTSSAAYAFSVSTSMTDSTGILTENRVTLSASQGGTIVLDIDAGAGYAGQFYWVAGSFSGVSPGVPLGGVTIPLNQDPYFDLALNSPNQFPFVNNVGNLDSNGQASVQVSLPAGFGITGSGTLHHACIILDQALVPLFVSDTVSMCISP